MREGRSQERADPRGTAVPADCTRAELAFEEIELPEVMAGAGMNIHPSAWGESDAGHCDCNFAAGRVFFHCR